MNEKQVTVLKWVDAGADPNAYPEGDYAHRISARGLANRGLVVISGQGSTWSAALTSDGHKRLADLPRNPPPNVSADLFARVLAAGGSLLISEDDTTNYNALVENSLHSPSRPHGQKLETRSEGPWFRARVVEVYLTEFPRELIQPKPVPIAARLRNPHPVVKAFKSNPDASYVSKGSMDRAARVYDAIAKEAEQRGYRAQDRETFLRGHQVSLGAGHLVITAQDHNFPIAVREISGTGGAKLEYPAKYKQPAWVQNRGYEFVSTGKLELRIDGPGTPYQGQKLRETRQRSIEDILPEVFVTIEVGGQDARRAEKQRQVRLLERQSRWEAAMDAAKAKHRAVQIQTFIASKAEEWRADQELSKFLDALEQRMPEMSPEQRDIAATWLGQGRSNVQGHKLIDELPPLQVFLPQAGELRQYLPDAFTETRPS
ncbi:hypothetical protein [Frigoribacterium sp. PhB160]|uniref:hypothetical protein n=1 Tax=Frigoribacterium sp. PhB160 TaxID=2485192 RepID=UPI0011CECF70|nr:hypothetical protein [Frigoribacterium sp. PhB160]